MSVKERILSIRLLGRNKQEFLDEIGVAVALKEKDIHSEIEKKRRKSYERVHVKGDS